MLPVLEWLVDNWDPLLHEERLPLSNSGLPAAESLSRTRQPPLSPKDADDFDWLDTWSAWWARHCIRAGREGGPFPTCICAVTETAWNCQPAPNPCQEHLMSSSFKPRIGLTA